MTEILDRRRREKTASRLPDRIDALARILQLEDGRLEPSLVEEARAIASRARTRLTLSSEHTVVALAGSTGSGKSSLFNAIAGLDLAQVGVRRPTTSTALACVWGSAGAAGVLEWLGIDVRHQVMRSSVLENADDTDLRGLVLLDLPDHDSIEDAHRLEVARMVERVDVLIWVVDPQKYADAAIHEAFLRPLAGYADVVVVILNHVDRLTRLEVDTCAADLRRLLADDGLDGAPLLMTSAATGKGVKRLRALLGERVLKRRSYAARLSADLDHVGSELELAVGRGSAPESEPPEERRLADSFATAAGVDAVVSAVERSYAAHGAAQVAWPPVRLVRSMRRDPLRRLGLDPSVVTSRASVPAASPVQRAQVDAATRRFGESVAQTLPEGWARSTRAAARRDLDELPNLLDDAVGRTDLGVGRTPAWWRTVAGLQWLLFATAIVGAGWLVLLALSRVAGVTNVPTPTVAGWSVPTLLLAVGLVAGIGIGALSRPLILASARRTAGGARQRLSTAVADVANTHVVQPVQADLDLLGEVRTKLAEVVRVR